MANCYKRFNEGAYNCGGSYYISDITSNVTAFAHNTSNAAYANLTISNTYKYTYGNIAWANPNAGNNCLRLCYTSSVENKVQKLYREDARWTGCWYGDKTNILSGNFTGVISASDSTVKVIGEGKNYPSASWYGTATGDKDFCDVTITLNNNQKILPPKGLNAQIQSYTRTTLKTTASITSWSDNTNIKGTPYTQGGGRTWNFMAEIKAAKDTSSTTIKRIEKNTGNTMNATWNFTGLELAQNTTYWVRYVVSNEFQQIQETWLSFTTPKVGPMTVTIGTYNRKRVNFTASVPSIASTSANWTFRLKNVNHTVLATKTVQNTTTLSHTSFFDYDLLLGKDYIVEAVVINKEDFSASGQALFHMYMGWVVWSNGTKKRIGQGKIITTSSSKEIISMDSKEGWGPVTAKEYDTLNLESQVYDEKNLTAYNYDENARKYLY